MGKGSVSLRSIGVRVNNQQIYEVTLIKKDFKTFLCTYSSLLSMSWGMRRCWKRKMPTSSKGLSQWAYKAGPYRKQNVKKITSEKKEMNENPKTATYDFTPCYLT